MSRYIATRALRGANALVTEAELMLQNVLAEKGPDTPVAFPNTAYYLPTIVGMTGIEVEQLGQLEDVVKHARSLLHPVPSNSHWTPYLGETLDGGMATLLAAGLTQVGQAVDTAGTSAIMCIYSDEPVMDPRLQNLHHGMPGWIPFGIVDTGGVALKWFKDSFCHKEILDAARSAFVRHRIS